jgi:hypothetical protein
MLAPLYQDIKKGRAYLHRCVSNPHLACGHLTHSYLFPCRCDACAQAPGEAGVRESGGGQHPGGQLAGQGRGRQVLRWLVAPGIQKVLGPFNSYFF